MQSTIQRSPHGLPRITLRDVTFRAGGVDTFHGLHLEIGVGELWVLAGPTGSGKSLLLEGVAGHVPTSAGEILYRMSPRQRAQIDFPDGAIGIVSPAQHRALASQALDFMQARWSPREGKDSLTVKRLLRQAVPRATTREHMAALRTMGIGHLLDRDLAALSNGEFRRALFARALLARPRVLLLDDPFAGLDQASRAHLHHEIASFARQGGSVMMAIPRAGDLPATVTHLLTLERERITYQGPFSARQFARAIQPSTRRINEKRTPLPPLFAKESKPRDNAPLIEMRQVTVRYGSFTALKRLDWIVNRGEKWALRGPNGAGKTTFTNLILGDHPQGYSNELYLFGTRRGTGESLWDIKKRIGWMGPELQYTFPGAVRAFDVVCSGLHDALGLNVSPSRAERTRARAWLRYLGVDALSNRAFEALSDGEQRLILLARALVKSPPLLVLDEPSQGLDEAHRRLLHRAINALARVRGLTMILITHLDEDLPRGITHELRLAKGRAVRNGPRPS